MEFEVLCKYVQDKLLESNAIPEWAANPWNVDSLAAPIIHNTLRQAMSGDKWAWEYCNEAIDRAIRFPPEAAEAKHFSLKLWVRSH